MDADRIRYPREFLAEKLYRDAKVTQIFEGPNEICRLAVCEAIVSETGMGEVTQ